MPNVLEINGAEYRVSPVSTSDGIDFAARLLGFVGDVIGAINVKGEPTEEALGSAVIFALSTKADPKLVKELAAAFAAKTEVVAEYADDGETPLKSFPLSRRYEEHFAGKYGDWIKWFTFAADVSLGSFLGAEFVSEIKRLMALAMAKATPKSGSKSQKSAETNG
jgi:hypothetical protein